MLYESIHIYRPQAQASTHRRQRRALLFQRRPVVTADHMGRCLHVARPAKDAQEGVRTGQGGVVLERWVPHGFVRGFPAQGLVLGDAPAVRPGQGRVELGRWVVVIAVERVGFDDEQTQVEVFRLHRALFAHHRAVAVAVGKRRADRLQRVAVVGDPLQVGARLGDGLGERWVAK